MTEYNRHFLLLCNPAQGQINPTLELAKRLRRSGAVVTFATTVNGLRRMPSLSHLDYLNVVSFSDGNDDGNKTTDDYSQVLARLKRVGSETLKNLLVTLADQGRPVTFLIYTPLHAWAAVVARDMHVPSAFFCTHSATSFAIYNSFTKNNCSDQNDPSISIKLQGLPLFACNDLPTFLLPNSPYFQFASCFEEHIKTLEEDPHPCVLINTFYSLEEESIKAVDKINIIAIGPLIPSAFLDRQDPSDTSPGIDLFEQSKECDYLRWLNTKPNRSVVYVSFGSMVVLQKTQMEEILQGLIESRKTFLWVIKSSEYEGELKEMIEDALLGREEQGLKVPWCSQLKVLGHESIGCFVTHCGWNSIMESIIFGVPIVGCPHFSDQTTNAKMVDEVWEIGVRAKVNEQEMMEREEIKSCLDLAMGEGERVEEFRRNVMKWRSLAMEAANEGGSSHNNFKHFLENLVEK